MKNESIKGILVIDIETTGPDIFENDATYIHIAPLTKEEPSINLYIRYTEHQLKWSSVGSRYFKTYKQRWENEAVEVDIAWREFCDYIHSYEAETIILAGHNIAFDYYFIKKLARLNNAELPKKISHRLFDSHSLLLNLYLANRIPQKALTLTGALNYFDIKYEALERHSAKRDVELTKIVFRKCLEMTASNFK